MLYVNINVFCSQLYAILALRPWLVAVLVALCCLFIILSLKKYREKLFKALSNSSSLSFKKFSEIIQLLSLIVYPVFSYGVFWVRFYVQLDSAAFVIAYFSVILFWFFFDEKAYQRVAVFTYAFLKGQVVQRVIYWCLVAEQLCAISYVLTVAIASLFLFSFLMSFFAPTVGVSLIARFFLCVFVFYIKVREYLLNNRCLKLELGSSWQQIIQKLNGFIVQKLPSSHQKAPFLSNRLFDKSFVTFPILIFKQTVFSIPTEPSFSVVSEVANSKGLGALKVLGPWVRENPVDAFKTASATISTVVLAAGGVCGAVLSASQAAKQAEQDRELNREMLYEAKRSNDLKSEELAQQRLFKAQDLELRKEEIGLRRLEINQGAPSMPVPQRPFPEINPLVILKSQKEAHDLKGAGAREIDRMIRSRSQKSEFLPNDSMPNSFYSQILSIYKFVSDFFV